MGGTKAPRSASPGEGGSARDSPPARPAGVPAVLDSLEVLEERDTSDTLDFFLEEGLEGARALVLLAGAGSFVKLSREDVARFLLMARS